MDDVRLIASQKVIPGDVVNLSHEGVLQLRISVTATGKIVLDKPEMLVEVFKPANVGS